MLRTANVGRWVVAFVLAWIPMDSAHARQVEAGDVAVAGGLGVGVNLGGSKLAANPSYVLFSAGARYAISSTIGVVGEIGFGLSEGTLPLRLRAGVSFHIPDLEWPIQPFLKAQGSLSQLFGVLGADLTVIGLRAAVGVDYFLTAEIGAGIEAALDLGTTLGLTPTFYGVMETLAFVSYTF